MAKIGADTAENERNLIILPTLNIFKKRFVTGEVAVDAAALAGLLALAGLALAAARRRFGTARVGGAAAAGPKTVVVAAKEGAYAFSNSKLEQIIFSNF